MTWVRSHCASRPHQPCALDASVSDTTISIALAQAGAGLGGKHDGFLCAFAPSKLERCGATGIAAVAFQDAARQLRGVHSASVVPASAIVPNDALNPFGPAVVDTANQFPNVVVLAVGCTGTLISPKVVLTAAHCVVDPNTGQKVNTE